MDEKNTAPATLNNDASFESAAAFADAESREILNLLGGGASADDAGGCCGGGCCSV